VRTLEWLDAGTTRLFGLVAALPSLAEPSLLDGWTRHTLVAHLALNARALHNLVDWARTGVETPMYPSPDARAADIAALAARPEAEVRQSMVDNDAAFQTALRSLPESQFSATVRTAQGRTIPVSEVPWMRNREVWVHAVDLNAGATFEEIPADVLAALLDDASSLMSTRPEAAPVAAHATDVDRTWSFGPAPVEVVTGPLAQVCAWALGRRTVPEWPTLPRWL
jgi:maleylpyruvate isomerase